MKLGARIAILGTAACLFAHAAVPALAQESATIHGEAAQDAIVSIEISGRGSTSVTPLTYTGSTGDVVYDDTGLYVLNDGQVGITALYVSWGSDPVAGADVWTIGDVQGPSTATWALSLNFPHVYTNVPAEGRPPRPFHGPLAVGRRLRLDSRFGFPTAYSDRNEHVMSALISAEQ